MRTIVEKSMLGKAWILSGAVEQNQGIDDGIIKSVLSARGITAPDKIDTFLNPSIREQMPDPAVLQDMDVAVRIIADAVTAGRRIAIFGDYDVDGITSVAIVVKYLRAIGCDPLWHLPTREGEGYGLNIAAVEDLVVQGAEVLISVDCGISGVAEVLRAKELNLAVVITDHHSPDGELPAADAVVNPKRADDTSGLSYLAGVGVAYLFLVALNRELRGRGFFSENGVDPPAALVEGGVRQSRPMVEPKLLEYMDLVALGTICDMMPLVGLNRAFASTGLRVMDAKKNLGLSTLMQVAGAKRASACTASFIIGPRLNAAGRLDSANPGLELLLTDNPGTAGFLAQQLNDMNRERVSIQNSIMLRATELAEQSCRAGKKCLFIVGDNWHKGVMGIIAGRLKDKFSVPVCVATRSEGVIDGSGRSIPGVDLGKIIHDAVRAGILTDGGGHVAAAGFGMAAGRESEFCEFFENAVDRQLGECPMQTQIAIDAEVEAGGANMNMVNELSQLAPFGQGNPEPMLVVFGGELAYATTMGGGEHLRGALRTGAGTNLSFVGFNLTGTPVGRFLLDEANVGRRIKFCGRLQANEYQGRVSAQFVIEDAAL